MRSSMRRGFTLIELLVVIAIIAILASILFPVFAKAREKARQATCTSQVRQIAIAIQMFMQDNQQRYPGINGGTWNAKLAQYLGSAEMLRCPSDTEGSANAVSYAYSGLLVRADGLGVTEAAVKSASEVGAICDASPSEDQGGRLIGGGGLQPEEEIGAQPKARHANGVVIGYCDGHAKYYQGSFDEKNLNSDVTRAFYAAASFGLIDNPTAMLNDAAQYDYTGYTGKATLGGEYAVKPFIEAAAALYAGGSYTRGFNGSDGVRGTNYVWGYGTEGPGQEVDTGGQHIAAIAFDAVCVIVAKGSRIQLKNSDDSFAFKLPSMFKSTYIVPTADMRTLFTAGYQKDGLQVYRMSDKHGITTYVKRAVGMLSDSPAVNESFGTDSVLVENDLQMVEKVASDPYAIGYCSSAFADPDRVVVLGLSETEIWPTASDRSRWTVPALEDSNWPWIRALNVTCDVDNTALGTDGTSGGSGIAANLRNTDGNFMVNLYSGPYFKVGYWPGNYTP